MNSSSDTNEGSPHSGIAREHIHGQIAVGTPELSPDGRRLASVVATVDLDANETSMRIWLDGAPLTAGPKDSSPTWSPDGRWLAFTSQRGEKKGESTLHVVPVEGPGEVRQLCSMPDGLGDIAWSPDGSTIAFTSRTQDERYGAKDVSWQSPRKIERFFSRLNGEDWIFDRPQHVYVVPFDGTGTPRNLTPGPFQHNGISWLHDSSGVVAGAQRHDSWDRDLAEDLYLIPLDGEIVGLTEQTGMYGSPTVSPDGSMIAFMGIDDPTLFTQNHRIGLMGIDGSDRRWISEALDRTFMCMTCMQAPQWADASTIVAPAEDRGDTRLYRLTADGSVPEAITPASATITGFSVAGGSVAYTMTRVDQSPELWLDRGDGATQQITSFSRSWRSWEKFGVPCADGTDEIDAWIMRPEGFDPSRSYPVLLNVHGGPFTQYGEFYFDEAQMQASAGFVVLMSNPRGGSGRHTAWGQAINGRKHPSVPGTGWGSVDVDDVLSVLDGALERFSFCDADRVGMIGGSYGGYMATTLAARHGERFRAICSERAVNNLLSEEWASDISTAFRTEHGVDPVEDPAEYLRMSPSELARDIHVPMLIIHSEDDLRCPINQAEELWVTLRLLGRDVTFYRFPGENHELSRSGSPVHRQMRGEIILDFFAEHLLSD